MVEILKLREACKNDLRTRALLEILFETGCRVSEIVGVNREDINWEKRSIKIFGKGSKERTVYFHVNTYFYLTKYLATREDPHPALFVTKINPTERLHARSIQIIIKDLGKKANLTKNIHPHALRHTFGTYLLNKGMDISIVSELLGHERLSTTQIYAKLTESRKSSEYLKYFV
jgi:integrase/recombinase XerD